MLKGKKVLLGITASIAAYKAAELVRLLKKSGSFVKVIQTEASLSFIPPLTLSTLSENPVLSEMVDNETGEWISHVELGLWADFMIIAPVTANTMAKMTIGECDNLLLATYLSAKCPVYFAPAMDLDMYKHPSTSKNIQKLETFGNKLIPSGFGELASGLVGEGRMAEPSEILQYIITDLSKELPFSQKNILITAGPTYESIDPVRFIGNRSSGKMGIALAQECAENGAKVILVLGPSNIHVDHPNITLFSVESTQDMFKFVDQNFKKADIGIFAAAVSDYAPILVSKNKIKKSDEFLEISLKKNIDILSEMASRKNKKQILIGFALESENELENAKSKLKTKNLDMIVLNSLNNKGTCFSHDKNKVTIIDKYNNIFSFELKQKTEVAKDIVEKIKQFEND